MEVMKMLDQLANYQEYLDEISKLPQEQLFYFRLLIEKPKDWVSTPESTYPEFPSTGTTRQTLMSTLLSFQ